MRFGDDLANFITNLLDSTHAKGPNKRDDDGSGVPTDGIYDAIMKEEE